MNGISVYGQVTSLGIALVGSLSSQTLLAQASANRVSRLSSQNIPLVDVPPTIDLLSQVESSQTNTRSDLSDLRKTEITYTQKQLECAERMGIDLSECTAEGTLIKDKENPDKILTVQKKSIGDVTPKQASANRTNVDLEHCNAHGVFTNKTEPLSNDIRKLLNVHSWNDLTPDDLSWVKKPNATITALLEDASGVSEGLRPLNLRTNPLKSLTIVPDTLINLQEFSLNNEKISISHNVDSETITTDSNKSLNSIYTILTDFLSRPITISLFSTFLTILALAKISREEGSSDRGDRLQSIANKFLGYTVSCIGYCLGLGLMQAGGLGIKKLMTSLMDPSLSEVATPKDTLYLTKFGNDLGLINSGPANFFCSLAIASATTLLGAFFMITATRLLIRPTLVTDILRDISPFHSNRLNSRPRPLESSRWGDFSSEIEMIDSASLPYLMDINRLITENKQMMQRLKQYLVNGDKANKDILSLLEEHNLMSAYVDRVTDPITLDIMTIPIRCYTHKGDQSYSDLYSIDNQVRQGNRHVIDPLTRNIIVRIECDSERLRFIHSTLKELSNLLGIDFKTA